MTVFLFTLLIALSYPSVLGSPTGMPSSLVPTNVSVDPELDAAALLVLQTKCNQCHRKKSPMMIFKEKNMARRAGKIYQQVFVLRRMPMKEAPALSEDEYDTLKRWLLTQKLTSREYLD